MEIDMWHIEERLARKRLKALAPNHPTLLRLFPSTRVACQTYWEAIREVEEK